MKERNRRLFVALFILLISGLVTGYNEFSKKPETVGQVQSVANISPENRSPASEALEKLAIKGRAPKTGYARTQFSAGWGPAPSCDVRNFILVRDMTAVITKSPTDCTVLQGNLQDPYTGKSLMFVRGVGSSAVQIDHVVALSNAWQTGAQQIDVDQRFRFANDPLNLLAVDGPANQQKSDADAATWLPSNKSYRCQYVARQIAVKQKYTLWVTQAEHDAMQRVLNSCPEQILPIVNP